MTITIAFVAASGWLFRAPQLLRVWSGAPAIAADTTLLFLCCGCSLLSIQYRKPRLALLMAGGVLAVTATRLLLGEETKFFFSIHRFFPEWTATVIGISDVSIMTMVPSVALLFLLSACALILAAWASVRPTPQCLWGVATVGSTLVGTGCFALLALMANLHAQSGQRHILAQMSPWTALGGVIVGSSLCCLLPARYSPARHHLSIAIAILSLVALFFLRSGVDIIVLSNEDSSLSSRAELAAAYGKTQLIQKIVEAVQTTEAGQRGFLLTRDPAYLAAYQEGLWTVDTSLKELSHSLSPTAKSRRLTATTYSKMNEMAQTISLVLTGRFSQANKLVRSNTGLRLSREIRKSADQLNESIQGDITRASQANLRSIGEVKRAVRLSIFISILLLTAAIVLVIAALVLWTKEQQRLQESEALLDQRIRERTADLTEEIQRRGEAERSYRQSEMSLHIALHFAEVATWVWDPDADSIAWTGPVEKIFREVVGSYHHLLTLIHPGDREQLEYLIKKSLSSGVEYCAEFRIVLQDGTVRWISGKGGAQLEGDRVTQMYGVNYDITARKEAEIQLISREQALRERDQKLALIFETGAIGDWSWDIDNDVVNAHPVVWRMYGSEAAHEGEAAAWFQARQHPEDLSLINEGVRAALSGERPLDLEFRVVLPDASVHWLACRGFVRCDESGRPLQAHGLNMDITQRKEVEMALRESEAQFRQLAEAMPQIVWNAHPDGQFRYRNRRWYELAGLPALSEASWPELLHPEDNARFLEQWSASIESGRDFEMELRFRVAQQNETFRWYLARAVPVRNQKGGIVRWFGTATDIHEQKLAEESLESEVLARTDDLRRALQEKDVLFSEVHHRVKNNLQVISSLLRMQSALMQDGAAQTALNDSRLRVLSMAMIHERLYGAQRMDQLDFGAYAQSLIDELRYAYSQSQNIHVHLHSAGILLNVDQAIPCGLILNELITNALKYAYPQGAGEILISLQESPDSRVTLTVKDHGVGLPAGFDPKQSKSLGMSIVEVLSHQLGGTVQIESRNGAIFRVQFPRVSKVHPAFAA